MNKILADSTKYEKWLVKNLETNFTKDEITKATKTPFLQLPSELGFLCIRCEGQKYNPNNPEFSSDLTLRCRIGHDSKGWLFQCNGWHLHGKKKTWIQGEINVVLRRCDNCKGFHSDSAQKRQHIIKDKFICKYTLNPSKVNLKSSDSQSSSSSSESEASDLETKKGSSLVKKRKA